MPFAHSEPLARTETSVKTAPTTRTIETLVAMSPIPTNGETIPPIKKPDAPMAAESALVESAAGISACTKLANAVNSTSTNIFLNVAIFRKYIL